ncbi:hypothetical protein [Paenibacillus sp. KR2-11]|uniref:hypothetical protein n=1 Tax=Paenibacillus sp. KR2-11 TaxID=3385500 RepID=UPI0038FC91B6
MWNIVRTHIMTVALNLPELDQPFAYLRRVRENREKQIIAQSSDGLGVTNIHPDDEGCHHQTLMVDDDLEADKLMDYLESATYAAKLALIRTFNAKDFQTGDLEEIIADEMIKLGLTDELARKNASGW